MTDFEIRPQHLYIHWPFCSFKCHYCDFVAYQEHAAFQEKYHAALLTEIDVFAQKVPAEKKAPLKTIFIGGGTPSLYPDEWIMALFKKLDVQFGLDFCQEISLEANPADISEEKLETWESCGINRLSIGVQALNDNVLLKLNRRQRATDVYRAMKIAPKYIQNLSIDLILGLPGVTPHEWLETITQACQWPISHISIYFLMVHEKTPLYFKVEKGEVLLPQDDEILSLYEKTVSILKKAGFEHYEISNFARGGKTSKHNQCYWNGAPYKGFGVGASSFTGTARITNSKNLTTYLESCQKDGICADQFLEVLTKKQQELELLMLSLRQSKGLDLHSMVYFLSPENIEHIKTQAIPLLDAGFLERHQDTIRLTTKGIPIENEIIVKLFSY